MIIFYVREFSFNLCTALIKPFCQMSHIQPFVACHQSLCPMGPYGGGKSFKVNHLVRAFSIAFLSTLIIYILLRPTIGLLVL